MSETARTPGAAPVWPDKMITQAEAFAKAASWPAYALPQGRDDVVLKCGRCHQSTGQLRRGGVPYNGTLDEMLAMVLRHMVMAHDVPLNTRAPSAGDPAPRVPGPAFAPTLGFRERHPLPGEVGWPDDQSPVRIMTEGIEP